MADRKRRGADKADIGAFAQLRVQVDDQWQQDTRYQRDNAHVAHQQRELGAQLRLDSLGVVALEGALVGLLEEDQDRHDLTRTQPSRASALALSRRELFALPPRRNCCLNVSTEQHRSRILMHNAPMWD